MPAGSLRVIATLPRSLQWAWTLRRCLDKRIEYAFHAMAPREKLRVPLHSDHKALITHLYGLNQAIGRICHSINTRREITYSLMMHRIYHDILHAQQLP